MMITTAGKEVERRKFDEASKAVSREAQREQEILALYEAEGYTWGDTKVDVTPTTTTTTTLKNETACQYLWSLVSCKEKEETKETKEDVNDEASSQYFWRNYDIEQSLAPQLIQPKEFLAAVKLKNFFKVTAARRKLQRREWERRKFVQQREIVKIQKTYRRYVAKRKKEAEKDKMMSTEEESKRYTKFTDSLLNGIKLWRWSHSKKALVPCELRVQADDYQFFVFYQNAVRIKRYYFHDIQAVTKGYASPFLQQTVQPTDPDKHVSMYFRDRRHGGKEVSVDLMFSGTTDHKKDPNKHSTTTVQSSKRRRRRSKVPGTESIRDGPQPDKGAGVSDDTKAKADRNRFYNNMTRLIRELESDDAFFFSTIGLYCRVGRSIFERWERVTMINPDFAGSVYVDGGANTNKLLLGNTEQHAGMSPKKKKIRRKGCFEPHPLPKKDKPQNQDPVEVIYRWQRTSRRDGSLKHYGASWYSDTIDIDYGKQHTEHDRGDGGFFVNPMRKEVFTLQRCKLDEETGKWKQEYSQKRTATTSTSSTLAHLVAATATHNAPKLTQAETEAALTVPSRVRVEELKNHFEKKVEAMYGTMNVVGWRNTMTSEFDFEDDMWRRLIAFARSRHAEKKDSVLHTQAVRAARDLEDAMKTAEAIQGSEEERKVDPLLDDKPSTDVADESQRRNESRLHRFMSSRRGGPRRGSESSTAAARKRKKDEEKRLKIQLTARAASQQNIVKCRMELMRRIWTEPGDQIKNKMWAVVGKETFNTAQKFALTKDEKEKEELARREHHRRAKLRKKRNSSSRLFDNDRGASVLSTFQTTAFVDRTTTAPQLPSPKPKARLLQGDVKELPGTRVEVRVNETHHKRHVKLGLVVTKYTDSQHFTIHTRKREKKIVAKVALKLIGTFGDVPPSVDSAYQNFVISPGDLLVAVNGKTAESHDSLIDLTRASHHARILTFFRVDKARLQDDDYDVDDAPFSFGESRDDDDDVNGDDDDDDDHSDDDDTSVDDEDAPQRRRAPLHREQFLI